MEATARANVVGRPPARWTHDLKRIVAVFGWMAVIGWLKREIGSCGLPWGRPTSSSGLQYADDDETRLCPLLPMSEKTMYY